MITKWPLAAYEKIIRGDETTSEDQVAEACDPDVARRLVACWNALLGLDIEVIETLAKQRLWRISE